MKKRYRAAKALITQLVHTPKLTPALALRQALAAGYTKRDFGADLMAGVIVGMVALPLAMALAIASGVPPQHGIYTAIIGGGVIAVLGGSRTNVSGPTAAFVVILAPISAQYGLGGLLIATLMAGVILVVMGMARLGRLIEFIPHPVTTGFTAGIAVVIATLQIKDLLGVTPEAAESYAHRLGALAAAAPGAHWEDMSIGALTLAILVVWPRFTKRVPAPLVALAVAALAAVVLAHAGIGFQVETIGSRFHYTSGGATHAGIPNLPPLPAFPWTFGDAEGKSLTLSYDLFRTLAPSAFAIAMLGAIESLLCAVVADGMAGTKHDPDTELVAQGVGNILAPFFGGIAATGAIARTATNVRSGGRSPIAALTHAIFVLLGVVFLAPLLAYLPMAALAALLMIVAWNMAELKHFLHIVRVAPKSDVTVLLACFSLTVMFDMVVSVSIGVVLAALLFMRRMAEISTAKLVTTEDKERSGNLPPHTVLYEIAGPLFFGATQKAMSALESVSGAQRTVILHIGNVPIMDVTGLVALESSIARLHQNKVFVVIAGVQAQPLELFERAGIHDLPGRLAICATLDQGIALAHQHAGTTPAATVPPAVEAASS